MTYRLNSDWRNRRNQHFGNIPPNYGPMHYSIASYCTENKTDSIDKKSDLNELFGSEVYLNQLHMLPNPLQKNLADTLPKTETRRLDTNMVSSQTFRHETIVENSSETIEKVRMSHNDVVHPALSSIGNFLSGVFNVISSAMPFQRRPKSPDYCYDSKDFEYEFAHDGSPPLDFWLPAKVEPQNKNNWSDQLNVLPSENNINGDCVDKEMSVDCRAAVAQCEDKLNKVRSLLTKPEIPRTASKLRPRRPKKVFVEPNSIEEHFEDAFTPEDFVKLSNDTYIECVAPVHNTKSELLIVNGPKTKTEMAPLESIDIVRNTDSPKREMCIESTEIVKPLPDIPENIIEEQRNGLVTDKVEEENTSDVKTQIIQSCEDKVSRLKALLLERRKNNTKSCLNSSDSVTESVVEEICDERSKKFNKPISIVKTHNKRHKNPNRLNDKRKKSQQRRNMQDDMTFAHEIDLDSPSSVENTPKIDITKHFASQALSHKSSTENLSSDSDCFFDEITGRFHKASTTESEDSFQIVFTDVPQLGPRTRKISDCDSEDSFIIFEDSPDSCYTSTDVFGDETSDIEEEDEESTDYESDADSGHDTCKLAHSLSRTISDLTDYSLYEENAVYPTSRPYSDSEDEVDCAVKICDEVPSGELEQTVSVKEDVPVMQKPGVLLDEAKKLERKNQPLKKVHFSEEPPKVRVMRVWAFAARQARAGHWEKHAVDRERFKRRIADVDMAISWVLKPQHRSRIKFQRFMPWWNQLRRKEIAEKKEREEQEKKRKAEEEALRKAEEERVRLEEERQRLEEEQRKLEEQERERKRILKEQREEEKRRLEELERLKSEEERQAEQKVSGVKIELDSKPNIACKTTDCVLNIEDINVALENGNGNINVNEIAEGYSATSQGVEEVKNGGETREHVETEDRKIQPPGDQRSGDNAAEIVTNHNENVNRKGNETNCIKHENFCCMNTEKVDDFNPNIKCFVEI